MATAQRIGIRKFRRRLVAGSFPEYASLADALSGMRFIQADPIRAPARAQDLILRQRIASYSAGELERAFPDLEAEEGYLFAYGFMTPEVWKPIRRRPGKRLKKREREVLDAIADLGEVHPRDLSERFGRKTVTNAWGGKSQETKRILEKLHHHGYLRVSRREQGIRMYQVPPESADKSVNSQERYRQAALAAAHAFGPTTKRFVVAELREHNHLVPTRSDRLGAVESLVETGQLSEVDVDGQTYLWTHDDWSSEEVPERVRILAPFDPLVRDRERFAQIWGWEYRFEAYVPPAKRERGYYAMPVLWIDKVIGWANANVADDRLSVEFGYTGKRPRVRTFRLQAESEVEAMAVFLGLESGAWELTL